MKRYLITGVAGSGKSTLAAVFDKKGYQTDDIDHGFAEWRDRKTGQVVPYNPSGGHAWLDRNDWFLKLDVLQARLAESHDGPILLFGSAADLDQHLDLFDRTFLLEYHNEADILRRLSERDNNPYGKHPDELANILSYFQPYQEKMKAKGAVAIDCTLPIDVIFNKIEHVIKTG